jgi:uncharacterized protein YndB with AHSA1/START domain
MGMVTGSVQRRAVLPGPPEAVWDLLTDPALAGAWLGGRLQWVPAGGAELHFVDDGGTRHGGELVEVERPRRLRWRWWAVEGPDGLPAAEVLPSEVTLDLEARGPDTLIEVTERLLDIPVLTAPALAGMVRSIDVPRPFHRRGFALGDVFSGPDTTTVVAGGTASASTVTVGWGEVVTTIAWQDWARRLLRLHGLATRRAASPAGSEPADGGPANGETAVGGTAAGGTAAGWPFSVAADVRPQG